MQGAGNRQRYSSINETPTSACDSGCGEQLPRPVIGPTLLILTKLLGPNSTFRYNIERGYEERPGCRGVLRHEKMSQTSDNSTSFPGSSLFLPQAAQPRHETLHWKIHDLIAIFRWTSVYSLSGCSRSVFEMFLVSYS